MFTVSTISKRIVFFQEMYQSCGRGKLSHSPPTWCSRPVQLSDGGTRGCGREEQGSQSAEQGAPRASGEPELTESRVQLAEEGSDRPEEVVECQEQAADLKDEGPYSEER